MAIINYGKLVQAIVQNTTIGTERDELLNTLEIVIEEQRQVDIRFAKNQRSMRIGNQMKNQRQRYGGAWLSQLTCTARSMIHLKEGFQQYGMKGGLIDSMEP